MTAKSSEPLNLKVERLRRGKSIAAMACDIGVSEHVLRYAEKGGRPLPESALKIADYFGVDVLVQWPLEEAA
jgi:transcriptional regulator with XRE-family HTH domain